MKNRSIRKIHFSKKPGSNHSANRLITDIRSMINSARSQVAQTVNVGLLMLSWYIGKRLKQEVLGGTRAAYGEEIVSTVSRQLTQEYGQGYSKQNLLHMVRFIEAFPNEKKAA